MKKWLNVQKIFNFSSLFLAFFAFLVQALCLIFTFVSIYLSFESQQFFDLIKYGNITIFSFVIYIIFRRL